jgi:hypothetical protein
MAHTHVIDGKVIEFDDNTCPYCKPQDTETNKKEKAEILPRVYVKNTTIVMKLTKGQLITCNWWQEGSVYLLGCKKMLTDREGHAILNAERKVTWNEVVYRMPTTLLRAWITAISTEITNRENQALAPVRS